MLIYGVHCHSYRVNVLELTVASFRAAAAARAAGLKNPGSKEIPEGELDCLAGLTFVFTGELESLGREEAQNLAKKYSG